MVASSWGHFDERQASTRRSSKGFGGFMGMLAFGLLGVALVLTGSNRIEVGLGLASMLFAFLAAMSWSHHGRGRRVPVRVDER
jgi:hypothetical protein